MRITVVKFLPILSLFCVGVAVGAISVQTSKMLSVCDVLTDPKKYDGQVVTIRGALVSSLGDTNFDELAPLETERCYRRGGDSPRIGLIAYDLLGNPPKNWNPDQASFQRAQETLDQILAQDPKIRQLVVTLEGVIHDGGPEPFGVTRDPWHRADMLIAAWKEIRKP